MRTFLINVGVHALLIGFAFITAGFMSLAVPSEPEIEANRQKDEQERKKGFWSYLSFCLGQYGSAESRGFSSTVSHWSERPEGRRMIYAGIGCLLIAIAIGYYFGVFD